MYVRMMALKWLKLSSWAVTWTRLRGVHRKIVRVEDAPCQIMHRHYKQQALVLAYNPRKSRAARAAAVEPA